MSLLNKIKKGVQNSGSNKGKVLFVAKDSKKRIRFLHEIEDGIEVIIHDHFDRGINALCQKAVGKDCPYCDDDELRTREAYVWSVWDVDAKEVKLFVGYANNFNPLPSLVSMGETYGTMTDRDYVIQRDGSGTNTRYSVIPMDKVKFKNAKAKPYPKKKMVDILNKAFPVNESDSVDDQEVEDEDGDQDQEESGNEYEDMSPRELYMECVERGLKAKKKQKKKYYIDLLLEDDAVDDDELGEDWEDEEEDEEDEW